MIGISVDQSLEDDEVLEYNWNDLEAHVDPENNLRSISNVSCDYYQEEQLKEKVDLDKGFSLIHFNCRSLYKRFDAINDFLNNLKGKFKLIALSETWIDEERGDAFHMDGYTLYHFNRKNRKAGGVAFFVSSDLKSKVVQSMTIALDDLMECITVEIDLEKSRNIMVTCIYRKPGSLIETFTDAFEENLLSKVNGNKKYFFCGDLNIDLLKVSIHKASADYLDMLYARGLYPLITKPSRITETSTTLIDHIFTNSLENTLKSGLVVNDISDHLPVFLTLEWNITHEVVNKVQRYIRLRKDDAVHRFRNELKKEDWSRVYVSDVNEAFEIFSNKYVALYDKHCPLVLYQQRKKGKQQPWMTKGLERACKTKNQLYRDFIKCRTKTAEMKYKKYKNKLVLIMRNTKKEYFNTQLEVNKNNIKGTWKILNSLMANKKAAEASPLNHFATKVTDTYSKKDIANELNSFFVNIGPNLASKIDKGQGWSGESRVLQSMFLNEISEQEIISIVAKAKNKKSSDADGLDMVIIKETIDCIIKPLCYIFNLSFKKGIFPDRMKIAKVIPLFKSGDKDSYNNYRPVSLLSQFSKVLEKLFVNRFDSFIEKHQLISDCQHGFRHNRSTASALMSVIEDISEATQNKNYTIGVFIDLKKAFDTLDHSILSSKLHTYGVRGVVLDWLSSYLANRQQYVQLGDITSGLMKIQCGVPQGSVLGPKLFNLYINDICDVSRLLRFVLFADDTNLYCSGNNVKELAETVEREMEKLKIWFDANKLSLNLEKTKCMIFGNRRKEGEVLLSINHVIIERVSELRFLGVILDENFTWKSHITHVKKKVAKSIFILNKLKYVLKSQVMRMLYFTLIHPYLCYCAEVWGNTYKTRLNQLCTLQKRAVRIIAKCHYRDHTNRLFIGYKILKIHELIKFQTLLMMFKAKSKTLPTTLQHLFILSSESGNGRRKFDFKHQIVRTTQRKMCPSITGVGLWNSLNEDLKGCLSIHQFKKLYKKMVFNQYEEYG